jgi:hypothetical protein
MHREDATTVSFSVIEVSATEVRMSYQDGAPCESRKVTNVRMARKVQPDASAA